MLDAISADISIIIEKYSNNKLLYKMQHKKAIALTRTCPNKQKIYFYPLPKHEKDSKTWSDEVWSGYEHCLDGGFDPNSLRGDKNLTLMALAIANKRHSTVLKLLKYGVNIDVKCNDDLTAMDMAIAWSDINIIKLLLFYGAEPTTKRQNKVLIDIMNESYVKVKLMESKIRVARMLSTEMKNYDDFKVMADIYLELYNDVRDYDGDSPTPLNIFYRDEAYYMLRLIIWSHDHYSGKNFKYGYKSSRYLLENVYPLALKVYDEEKINHELLTEMVGRVDKLIECQYRLNHHEDLKYWYLKALELYPILISLDDDDDLKKTHIEKLTSYRRFVQFRWSEDLSDI